MEATPNFSKFRVLKQTYIPDTSEAVSPASTLKEMINNPWPKIVCSTSNNVLDALNLPGVTEMRKR